MRSANPRSRARCDSRRDCYGKTILAKLPEPYQGPGTASGRAPEIRESHSFAPSLSSGKCLDKEDMGCDGGLDRPETNFNGECNLVDGVAAGI